MEEAGMLFSGTPKRLMAASPRLLPVVIVIILGLIALPERRAEMSDRNIILVQKVASTESKRSLPGRITSRQLPVPATTMGGAKAVASGDFDEDGKDDFAIGYGSGADASLIVYNTNSKSTHSSRLQPVSLRN